MPFTSLLVANRGEIAIRIIRAAEDLGLRTIAVHTADRCAGAHISLGTARVAQHQLIGRQRNRLRHIAGRETFR